MLKHYFLFKLKLRCLDMKISFLIFISTNVQHWRMCKKCLLIIKSNNTPRRPQKRHTHNFRTCWRISRDERQASLSQRKIKREKNAPLRKLDFHAYVSPRRRVWCGETTLECACRFSRAKVRFTSQRKKNTISAGSAVSASLHFQKTLHSLFPSQPPFRWCVRCTSCCVQEQWGGRK